MDLREKRNVLSSSSNCLGQEHIGRSEELPKSTGETSAKYIPRNLSGVRLALRPRHGLLALFNVLL